MVVAMWTVFVAVLKDGEVLAKGAFALLTQKRHLGRLAQRVIG